MKKILFILSLLWSTVTLADLSGGGLTDYYGNGVTSNAASGTRNALDIEILLSGSIIDPRAIRTLTSGTDSVACVQSTSPWVNNISQFGGTNLSTGTGASGAGIPRITVSNDSSVGLNAGTNLVGKVGIDQTTPGTTNGVVVNSSALPTGAANQTNQSSQITQETATATALGTPADTAATSDTGTFSLISLFKRALNSYLSSIQNTSNSTATNTAHLTDGTQRTLVSDPSGNLQPTGDAPARTIYVRLNDGTNSSVVKAASTAPSFTDTALEVTQRPDTLGTVTQTSVSCGTSSTTLLAASTATMFISVRNPTTSTNTIWIQFNGSAATAAVPSVDLAPGAEADFFAYGPSFLPTSQFNCISGGTASSVALIYK